MAAFPPIFDKGLTYDKSTFNITEEVARKYSIKKGVLRNFAKFTGKPLCQSLFCNKVAGLRQQVFDWGAWFVILSYEYDKKAKNVLVKLVFD